MSILVADTSGLVSLATAAGQDPDPLTLCLNTYEVLVPEAVVDELQETASYDDPHGDAARSVLDRMDDLAAQSVSLDEEFLLDDGENAAVTLANDVEAELFLCDEFNRLGLIHASLAGSRLVTTHMLLVVFMRKRNLTIKESIMLFDAISQGRSWEENSYVERARSLLERS